MACNGVISENPFEIERGKERKNKDTCLSHKCTLECEK